MRKMAIVLIFAMVSNLLLLGSSDRVAAQSDAEPAAVETTNADYVISKFEEEIDEWLFAIGDTPAVKGSFNIVESAESYQGDYMGQIIADFTKSPAGSPYASIKKELDDLDIENFSFWIKTSDLKSIRIRTTDSTGQTFQQRITLQDTPEWQQIQVNEMGSNTFDFWNGANDGVWHEPAQGITILFDRFDIKNGALTATVSIDEVIGQLGGWLPDLKIQQTALGNIFLDTESSDFIIRTNRPVVNWDAYDIYGEKVATGSEDVTAGEARITVPYTKLGYFTLEVSAEQPGSEPFGQKTAFAVISSDLPPGNGQSPFGVSTHLNWVASGWSKELSKAIRYMGASFVRDGVEWSGIEKEKGVYTFTPSPDDYMKKLKDNDLKLLLVAAFNNPFYDNNGTPYTDAGRKGLAEFAKAYVGQYKEQLIGVNVYNEFNGGFGQRGNSPANSQSDYYFKLMKEMFNTVNAAHPEIPVVGIVSGGVDLNWIEGVFKGVGEGEDKNAGLKYLDAMSVQTYMDPNAPDEVFAKLEGLKTLVKQYNDDELVPIWVTEFGSPTHQSTKGVDEKTQANYLPRGFVIGLGLGVERMSWYDFMNDGLTVDYNEHNFGLVRHKNDPMGAYTPKPAYASYAAMSRQLAGATFEEIEQFNDSIKSNLFVKNGEELRVVWALENTEAVIATQNELEITDFMGNTEIYTPHNGKVYMTMTGEPFYIKGEISGIKKDSTFAIDGELTAIGDAHSLVVSMKNETDSTLSILAKVNENTYPITAKQGEEEAITLTVNEIREGFRLLTIHLLDKAGNQIGKLQHKVETGVPHKVTVRPTMEQVEDKYKQTLNIVIENFRKESELAVQRIVWRIGDQSGEEIIHDAVLPGNKQDFSISLRSIEFGGDHPASVRVEFDGQKPYVYEGNFSFNPIYRGTIHVNDELGAEFEDLTPSIDLSQGKGILLSGHSGKIELNGQAWLHYDQDNLYLSARIEDNVHSAQAAGANIWGNDSIQFALSPGIPGESLGWYEYGISDTPEGPQIYRWTTMGGLPAGLVHNGKVAVSRDEQQKLTIYKLALPWSELIPIGAGRQEVMSFSLLVNENDGNGRRGWLEWGSGIGNEKRPSLFRSMQWMFNDSAAAVVDATYRVLAGQEVHGILQATYGEEAELVFEIVENGKKGTARLMDEKQGEFVYTADGAAIGQDTFTFRVHDGYEYSNIATVTINIEKSNTSPTFPGGYDPSPNVSHSGQLFLPGSAAGKVSLGANSSLVIAAGTTDQAATISLIEREESNLPNQDDLSHYLLSSIIEVRIDPDVNLHKPMMLSLAFDSKKRVGLNDATIWKYNEQLKKWVLLGGEEAEEFLTVEINEAGIYAVFAVDRAVDQEKVELWDIQGHWAQQWIEQAVTLGIVHGYSDQTFQPDKEVNRQEFVALLVRALKPSLEASAHKFADSQQIAAWAVDEISIAMEAGWIAGYPDGAFRPHANMNRAEMTAIVVRSLDLLEQAEDEGSAGSTGFLDESSIPKWVRGHVIAAVNHDLIKGRSGKRFAANGIVTRAEAVTMMIRLLDRNMN